MRSFDRRPTAMKISESTADWRLSHTQTNAHTQHLPTTRYIDSHSDLSITLRNDGLDSDASGSLRWYGDQMRLRVCASACLTRRMGSRSALLTYLAYSDTTDYADRQTLTVQFTALSHLLRALKAGEL